jgi:hypothetical protein
MTRRFLCYLWDWCAFVLFAACFTVVLGRDGQRVNQPIRPVTIVWLMCIVLLLRFCGTTPGWYTFNLEVRSSRPSHRYAAIWELAMRETVFRWMSLLFFAGYIPTFSDSQRRSWSDRYAKTIVVMRQGKRQGFVLCLTTGMCALGFLVTFGAIITRLYSKSPGIVRRIADSLRFARR